MALGLRAAGRPLLPRRRGPLIDPSVADLEPWEAVGSRVGLLAVAWIVYDVLCRLVRDDQVRSPSARRSASSLARLGRGRAVQRRAPPGCRSARCSGRSWRQRLLHDHSRALGAGPRRSRRGATPTRTRHRAKQRSVHNNYLTLPVLVTMLAAHFGFLTGRQCLVLSCSIASRRLRPRSSSTCGTPGRTLWWMPVAGAAAVLALRRRPVAGRPAGRGGADSRRIERGRAVFARPGAALPHAAAPEPRAVGPSLDAAQHVARAGGRDRVTNGVKARCRLAAASGDPDEDAPGSSLERPARTRIDPDAEHRRRRLLVHGPPGGRGGAPDGRRVPPPAPARFANHPRALERRGRVDPVRRPRPRPRARERDVLPAPRRDRPVSRRRFGDGDPARVRLRQLRVEGRPAGGEPLRDDRGGTGEPARPRAALPLGGSAGDHLPEA